MKSPKRVYYQLVLDVSFNPHGTPEEKLEWNLRQIVHDAVNNGTLTEETEATVERYSYLVKKSKSSPKKTTKTPKPVGWWEPLHTITVAELNRRLSHPEL